MRAYNHVSACPVAILAQAPTTTSPRNALIASQHFSAMQCCVFPSIGVKVGDRVTFHYTRVIDGRAFIKIDKANYQFRKAFTPDPRAATQASPLIKELRDVRNKTYKAKVREISKMSARTVRLRTDRGPARAAALNMPEFVIVQAPSIAGKGPHHICMILNKPKENVWVEATDATITYINSYIVSNVAHSHQNTDDAADENVEGGDEDVENESDGTVEYAETDDSS